MGCGSSDDDRAVRIFKGAAIKEGVVTGFVLDDESELPVAAEVLVGGTAVRAQPDGSFQASATAGRVRVEVRSEGYLKTFRDVVAGDKALPMPFKVAHRGPKMPVGPAGVDVAHRGATLVVAPGTFPMQTQIALTHLVRSRVAAIAATPQFIDNTGVPRRAVALVDVDAESMPMVGMRVRVPVPADAAMDSLSGFTIDGQGNWTTAVAPASVSGGFAEFIFNGNNQIGIAVDVRKADNRKFGYLVTERGGSGKAQGDLLEGGTEVVAGGKATSIVDQHGSRIEMPPGTRARVEVPAGEMPASASRVAPYAGEVTVSAGRARAVVPPPAPGATKSIKLALKGTAGKYNVTGTGLTLATCLNGTDFLDFLEVVEGQVEVEAGTDKNKKTETVNAGESALVCTNCKAAPTPMCVEPAGPDGGTGTTPTPMLDGSTGMTTIEGGVPIDGPAPADAAPVDAVAIDAAPGTGGTGGGGTGGTGGSTPPPDAGPQDSAAPDAMVTPDAALMPDAAPPLPVDAAPLPPDAAPPLPPAMLSISPTARDFGAALVSYPGFSHTFTVTNVTGATSTGPLLVTSTGEFALTSNGCSGTLAAGASCAITMQFVPQLDGVRTGTLTVSALPGGSVTATLTGMGVVRPPPPPMDAAPDLPRPARLIFEPPSQSFGSWVIGDTSEPLTLTMRNVGDLPTPGQYISINNTEFERVDDNPCFGPIERNQTCQLQIEFTPSAVGARQGAVDVRFGGDETVVASAALTGTGLEGPLVLTPATQSFGQVMAGDGSFAERTFEVRNTSAQRTLTDVFVSIPRGQTPVDFFIHESDCQGVLDPDQFCTVKVRFSPQKPEQQQATLLARVQHDGGPIEENDSSVLTGEGIIGGGTGGQGGGGGFGGTGGGTGGGQGGI